MLDTIILWVTTTFDFPAIVLLLLLYMAGWVMYKTQQNPTNGFKFEDMLRDDKGKPSASRLAMFASLAASTWVIMYIVIVTKGMLDPWMFAGYIGVWSGAKVVEKAIDAYTTTRTPPSQLDNPTSGS